MESWGEVRFMLDIVETWSWGENPASKEEKALPEAVEEKASEKEAVGI